MSIWPERQYNGDKPSDSQVQGQTALDLYDPVVGKWMTNLVATTPITAKAMQSLIIELNRQKELKRTYRWRYKDLQMVTTATATPPVTSQPPINAMNTKNKCKFFNIEIFSESRKEDIREREEHQTS